jgi:hypothetical protein
VCVCVCVCIHVTKKENAKIIATLSVASKIV